MAPSHRPTSARQPRKRPRASSYKPSKARRDALQKLLARFPGGVPRPEYPRPRLVRGGADDWCCLNGVWEFSFDTLDPEGGSAGTRERWEEKTLPDFCVVPFAPQWALSGKKEREPFQLAWYARDFEVSASWLGMDGQPNPDGDVLLHFGACDYKTVVWINGHEAAHNQGGHVPFSLDLTPYLQTGVNRVTVRVEDRADPRQPRGKQTTRAAPSGVDYWPTLGLWQSVWLERAPAVRVQDVVLTPHVGADPQRDALEVTAFLHAPALAWRVEVEVFSGIEDAPGGVWTLGGQTLGRAEVPSSGAVAKVTIPLPGAARWSPDAPHLLGVRVRLFDGEQLLDEVRSPAGLRGVALRDGKFHLNGAPLYLCMALDQGYWPEGGLTAPSDEDLKRDVELAKAFGFNGARKHQKVEDPRWLWHCDRLGLLVWGEMANARAWSATAEEWFLAEWERAVRRDLSHPCIVAWVPLNESWGVPGLKSDHPAQHAFVERVVALTRRVDPTRPVVSNDGWEHADVTDIVAIHDYQTGAKLKKHWANTLETGALPEKTWAPSNRCLFVRGARHRGQPVMLTEIGGFLNIPDLPKDQWDRLYLEYNTARTPAELERKYRELMEIIASFPFVSGWCYTQLTDVEHEINGLLTYERKPKVAPERIAAIHRACFGERTEGTQSKSTDLS